MFDREVAVIIQRGKQKSEDLAEAVIAGHKGLVLREPEHLPAGLIPVVVGAWRTTAHWLHKFASERRPYVYVDNGYFRPYKEGGYFRATLNGLQLVADDGRTQPSDYLRFQDMGVSVKSWQPEGEHILLVLQTSQWFDMMKLDRETWVRDVLTELEQHTSREIRIREKPGKRTPGSPDTSIYEDMVGAHAVVALSSNCLIQATCEGIPIFPRGVCAATPLGNSSFKNIERPWRPDFREPVYRRLAGAQWTMEEIAGGKMWEAIRQGNPHAFQDLA